MESLDIPKTIAIIAFPYSGSTMLAGIMECFGIPMVGEHYLMMNWEDQEIINGLRDGYFGNVVAERNARHAVWGFKNPHAYDYMDTMNKELRNPIYLAIWKGLLSVTQRRVGAGDNAQITGEMHWTLEFMHDAMDKISESDIPVHMLSYIHAITKPDLFIEEVLGIIGIEVTDDEIARAKEFITPNTTADWRYPYRQVVRY